MILKRVRNNGTIGIPLRVFFGAGSYHLEGNYYDNCYTYLDTADSKSYLESVECFKSRSTPEENLNWDTIEFHKYKIE